MAAKQKYLLYRLNSVLISRKGKSHISHDMYSSNVIFPSLCVNTRSTPERLPEAREHSLYCADFPTGTSCVAPGTIIDGLPLTKTFFVVQMDCLGMCTVNNDRCYFWSLPVIGIKEAFVPLFVNLVSWTISAYMLVDTRTTSCGKISQTTTINLSKAHTTTRTARSTCAAASVLSAHSPRHFLHSRVNFLVSTPLFQVQRLRSRGWASQDLPSENSSLQAAIRPTSQPEFSTSRTKSIPSSGTRTFARASTGN